MDILSFSILLVNSANYYLLTRLAVMDAKIRSPVVALWFGLAILFVLPAFGDYARAGFTGYGFGYIGFDLWDVLYANIYAFSVLLLFTLLRISLTKKVIFDWSSVITRSNVHISAKGKLVYFFLIAVAIVLIYKSYGSLTSLGNDIGWVARRETLSAVDTGLINLIIKILCGFSLVWLLGKHYGKFAGLLAIYLSLFLFLGGSRLPLVIFFLPIVIFWVSEKNTALRFILLTASYGLLSQLMGLLRLMRFRSSIDERLHLLMNPLETIELINNSEVGETTLRFFYYAYISGSSYVDSFFTFQYLTRTLMAFVPSFLAPFKPDNFEYDMHLASSGIQATMHPTLFGSIYADTGLFGFVWVILLFLYLYLLPMLLKPRTSFDAYILYGTFAGSCLMISRGAIYGAVVAMLIISLFIYTTRKLGFKG